MSAPVPTEDGDAFFQAVVAENVELKAKVERLQTRLKAMTRRVEAAEATARRYREVLEALNELQNAISNLPEWCPPVLPTVYVD